jgi:hypothetical protein
VDGPSSDNIQEGTTMRFISAIRSVTAPTLAVGLLAGLVGVVAGAGLAVTTIHLASSTTPQTASTATHGNQGQASGHGAEVTAAVAKCKAALSAGQHGIGKCVSAVANKHGKAVSAAASANGQKNSAQDTNESDASSTP